MHPIQMIHQDEIFDDVVINKNTWNHPKSTRETPRRIVERGIALKANMADYLSRYLLGALRK